MDLADLAHPARTVGWTACAIAEGVRTGALSPVHVVREHLAQIARHDAAIGAFQRVRADAALREAALLAAHPQLASLPLAGVPIAIKDSIPVAGEPMRVGRRPPAA